VRDPLVLCYHAISPSWPAALSVTPDNFERQMRTLLGRGYRPTTFSGAVSCASERRPTFAVTFDDAYRSIKELAFPLLSRLGIPATVFVPTRFAGTTEAMSWPGIDEWLDGPHAAELHCMSWDELVELRDAGWEVGSHTHTHPYLPKLDDDALLLELRESLEICTERLGERCRSVAYPYGAYDERVVAAAHRAGYQMAATLPARMHEPAPLEWPRVGIYHGDSGLRFRAKISPTGLRLRSSSVWGAMAAGRRVRASNRQ
jgi:peptidoglycan/xylan/chitin deacetylase (PgdA/CDA1 family)